MMQALVKFAAGPDGVELRDIPDKTPLADQLKIRIHATGICGTDLHIVKDEYPCHMPVVMGHEFSGTVIEVGSAVQEFKPGDAVVALTAVVTCGKCRYCREGLLMLCDERLSIGSGIDGAFAENLVVPAHLAFKIPAGVSLDEAALCEPLACVVRNVIERATVKAGDFVFVSGPGTIGNLVLQVAVAHGAKVVVAGTESDRQRLELAGKLGAAATFVVGEQDEAAMMMLTEGLGFDVAFECAGAAASADTCLHVLKKTGLYSQVGLYGKKVEFDHDLALKKEITITNSFASERTSWDRALRLLGNRQVSMQPLISAKLPLSEWRQGFRKAFEREGYKILLCPGLKK
jgi:L-iditol 2-dehydrogenase